MIKAIDIIGCVDDLQQTFPVADIEFFIRSLTITHSLMALNTELAAPLEGECCEPVTLDEEIKQAIQRSGIRVSGFKFNPSEYFTSQTCCLLLLFVAVCVILYV